MKTRHTYLKEEAQPLIAINQSNRSLAEISINYELRKNELDLLREVRQTRLTRLYELELINLKHNHYTLKQA